MMDNAANILTEKLSQPKTVEALLQAIDSLTKLHESGALELLAQASKAIPAATAGAVSVPDSSDVAVADLKNVISLMSNAVTEKMVERNAIMMGELLSIADEAADPSMLEALKDLKRLQTSGNLKALVEASDMLGVVFNAVTDTMVQRMASLLASFVEELASPQILDSMKGMTTCLSKTINEFAINPPKPGIKSLVTLMREPDVQMGMMFMATLAKNMRNCMIDSYSGE
ncbi:MAG: DUF1641 domain-containing protein [Nitrospirota bacterium]